MSRGNYLSENQPNYSKVELSRSPNRKTCRTQTGFAGLEAEIAAGELMISSSAEPYAWIWADAPYLREQAQRCSRLARDCPHLPTAHELEAIGMELMQRAADLDHMQEEHDTERPTRE